MKYFNVIITSLLLMLASHSVSSNEGEIVATTADWQQKAQLLVGVKLKAVPDIIKQLEAGGELMVPLFKAMLAGDLYYRKSDKTIVIAEKKETGEAKGKYQLNDALTGKFLENTKKKSIKKVKVNNRIRKLLRATIAKVTLFSGKVDVRKSAVRNMLNSLDKNTNENITLLTQAKEQEKNKEVLSLIDLALAVNDLTNTQDTETRLAALAIMDGSLEPKVINTLQRLLEKNDAGEWQEADTQVLAKAQTVAADIERKIDFYELIEQLFFGLSLGSVLLLVATGLAITFGVMGVINMAHGELIMLGAYTTYVIQLMFPNHIEYSILIAIPAAFIVSGSVGILIERGVIQFLHGRPLETLLATFGISLILQQAVRTIFSPLNRQVESPMWLSGSLEINSVLSITYNRLYILLFALLVFVVLQLVLKKTSLGLHVRAVSQNRGMAKAIGIRTEWVDAATFGLGSGIAGIAGVALSQLTNVGPNLGQAYIIDSFMVVVFGGVGNLWGTLVGGFTLGVANKFLEPATGAVLANIIILVFIILFIQKRPRGLFPQKGRAAG